MKMLTGIAAAVLLFAVGCIGEVPPQPDGEDPIPGADADVLEGASLSGQVQDWFTGDPIPNVTLTTAGLATPLTATSGADGSYSFEDIPTGQEFSVVADAGENYLTTTNPRMQFDDVPLVSNLRVVSLADTQRQHATVGLTYDPLLSFVVADLLKGDGTPRDGVALADVLLVDALQAPAGAGTYFIGALGDIDPVKETSSPVNGRASAAVLNVPPATLTFNVTYPADQDGGQGGGNLLKTEPLATLAGNAIIVEINSKVGVAGGGGDGN